MSARPPTVIDVGDQTIVFDWGERFELGTAAYWTDQARRATAAPHEFALGDSLAEEVVACLLGGYGVPAAIGLAAFDHLRRNIDLSASPEPEEIVALLEQPLPGLGRRVNYRFPRQRGARIAAALSELRGQDPPSDPLLLRDWLQRLSGIGPKTASWIVRNRMGCDDVAIIDVHIRRAGIGAGFFSPEWLLPRAYARFERAFLRVAEIGGVRPSVLDAYMWNELQRLGRYAQILYYSPHVVDSALD